MISLYFQHVRGYSALDTGLALLPKGLFVALASVLSGQAHRHDGRAHADAARAS